MGFALAFSVACVLASLVAMVPVLAVRVAGRCGWRYTGAAKVALWVVFGVLLAVAACWVGFGRGTFKGVLPVFVLLVWAAIVQGFARDFAGRVLRFYDSAKAEARL